MLMPKLTVEGFQTVDVPHGKRLVLAIEEDAGVDVLHACGGNARCTTCRVEFIEGEPTQHTVADGWSAGAAEASAATAAPTSATVRGRRRVMQARPIAEEG